MNAVELTKKIRSHAAAAPPAALPAAPKVECIVYIWGHLSHKVLVNVNLTNISFSSGGFGHKAETIDQCSQVHAFHEGRSHHSDLPPHISSKHADSHTLQGNPEEPKCGFSKQTVGIFKDLEADYGTFDILNDDEVGFLYFINRHQ